MKENTTMTPEVFVEANEDTNLAVASDFAQEAQAIIHGLEGSTTDFFASFDITDPANRVKLFNAISGDGGTIKDNLNKVLEVKDVIVCAVSIRNEDGTLSTVPRTTLCLTDGRMVSASSWGVYNSIKRLTMFFPDLKFDEPIKLVPVEVKTKNGFTINLRMQ